MTLVANDGFFSVSYQTPVVLDADHKILYGSIPGMDSDTLSDEAYGYLKMCIRDSFRGTTPGQPPGISSVSPRRSSNAGKPLQILRCT